MSAKEFVEKTILHLSSDVFCELKETLFEDYIPFQILKKENISRDIFAEKLCDYFKKVELKKDTSFENIVEKYMSDIELVVSLKIAETPDNKKGEPPHPVPRARKYYAKAIQIKKANKSTKQGLTDYTRLMLCLYMSIINSNFAKIENFDYSIESLNISKIIDALRNEKNIWGKKSRFDTADPYDKDRCTFVLLIIMFYYIKNKDNMIGEG